MLDAFAVDLSKIDLLLKSESGEDRQLVGRINALHVHAGILLGITPFLCLTQTPCIGFTGAAHFGQNVIAGAVQDSINVPNPIGRKPLF